MSGVRRDHSSCLCVEFTLSIYVFPLMGVTVTYSLHKDSSTYSGLIDMDGVVYKEIYQHRHVDSGICLVQMLNTSLNSY